MNMSRPILAIDIDGVLADHTAALAAWHNQTFGTRLTVDDYISDEWRYVWNTSADEAERRAQAFHATGAHGRFATIRGAKTALRELKKTHDLILVTVRRRNVIDATYQWLEVHYPGLFQDVHFIHYWDDNQRKTKAEVCQQIGAHYLIDDSLKHCLEAAEAGIPALLFGVYAWNKAETLPRNVTRVPDWKSVQLIVAQP